MKATKKTSKSVKSVSKASKKSAVKQNVKKVSRKKSPAAKKTAKKAPVKVQRVSQEAQEVVVSPVLDAAGMVVMRSAEETANSSSQSDTVLTPHFDQETGALTMVPTTNSK